jgi:hypothetical protein
MGTAGGTDVFRTGSALSEYEDCGAGRRLDGALAGAAAELPPAGAAVGAAAD